MTAVRHGDRSRPWVALTFDDAPHPAATPSILDTLGEWGAPATFFCIGQRAHDHPRLARLIADQGHEVGNHAHIHVDLTAETEGSVTSLIHRAQDAIHDTAGVRPRLFRPPFGCFGPRELDLASRAGLRFILWDVDPRDFEAEHGDDVAALVAGQAWSGSIILLHADRDAAAGALPRILQDLEHRGLKPVTVSAMLNVGSNAGRRRGREDRA